MSEAILFEYPYNLFLMQRLEFVLICQDDIEALIMRLVEYGMTKQKEDWQAKVLEAIEAKKTPPKEPKTYWVRLSQGQIIARLYKYDSKKVGAKHPLSLSKSTIRHAINSLIEKGFLGMRSKPGDEFGSPIYTLHRANVQKALKELPSDPFAIFSMGGVSNFGSGEFQNTEVPPTNFGSGELDNSEVGVSENGGGEFQNLDINIDRDNNLEDSKEIEQEESIPLSASAEESMPTENIRDFKTESAKLKAVSLHVATVDYQKEEDTGERERVIRPVLTIGGGNQHDRNDLSSDWSIFPGAVHDKPGRGLSSPGGVGQTESAGGGQTETGPAHPLDVVAQTPDAGTHSLAATPPGDGQDDGTRGQALPALPDAGQVASAPAASTALGVFSPTPTSGVQQGAAGHTSPKPRLKKTVIVKDIAGPPAFPSESDAWGTTTCLRLFDFWRGAPLCDVGQLKYASSCAKRLAETYSRVQVVLVRTAMNNQKFWKEQGGADVCDVARHMGKELNKLKMPVAPAQQQPDQSRPTLEEVECIDPTWCVYQRPGDTQEWILWQGELLTEDEANDRGYGGGGGLYIQTQYA